MRLHSRLAAEAFELLGEKTGPLAPPSDHSSGVSPETLMLSTRNDSCCQSKRTSPADHAPPARKANFSGADALNFLAAGSRPEVYPQARAIACLAKDGASQADER